MSNFRRGNLCQVGQRTKHGQQLRKIFLRIYKNQYLFKTLNPKKIATTLRTANIFSKKLMSQLFQFHNSNFLSQFCPAPAIQPTPLFLLASPRLQTTPTPRPMPHTTSILSQVSDDVDTSSPVATPSRLPPSQTKKMQQ